MFARHVTFAVVPIVSGVHHVGVVVIQYLVVLVSFGVNVTRKSVLLHVSFALSVVTGAVLSTFIINDLMSDRCPRFQ